MIPSVLAQHVEQGVKDFLKTTFPITTPFFANILETFLNEPGQVFKGPYLDIQLPFQKGNGGPDYFPNLPMPFQPHLHQEKAFDRLSGTNPKATIVATGTGSGKTECFLYPILNYCYEHRGEPGIKAILIYPMNALATDQAGRLARLIHNSMLKGHLTAGIYVGQKEKTPSMLMSQELLISDKETLRLSPPDILLTNYKMLDYLLIRPEDRPLWVHNTSDTLRFMVVDELHTFDGAQGSDLACLIRRLKARLAIESGYLCCVGTSATLGTKAEQDSLLEYASSVFGENFTKDAIITESRKGAGEFLEESFISYVDIVSPEKARDLDPVSYHNYQEYINAQHKLWFDDEIIANIDDSAWRIALGNKIKEHLFFQNLLKTLNGKIRCFDDIFNQLEKVTRGLEKGHTYENFEYKINLLNSLLALISEARVKVISNDPDGNKKTNIRPFLNIRLQLWTRELRRMLSKVSSKPQLRFADDLNDEQLKTHLPLVHCRECGSMGWSGLKRKTSSEIKGDLQDFYHAFFSHDPKVVYLFPEDELSESLVPRGKNKKRMQELKVGIVFFCTKCLNISNKANLESCPYCENDELLQVFMPDVRVKKGNRNLSKNECPYCNSQNSLTLLGSRAASLTSVMIVQLYSSTYNNDKKLLTFSDNVQDAAHRAGFFNSRTYRFNFRTALQKVVLANGNGKTLAELPKTFIDYWTQKIDPKRYIATFLAPNMEWLNDFDYLKKHDDLPDDSSLIELINNRISWEIISEYGFRARIGRTLEKTDSSVIYLDKAALNEAAIKVLEHIQNEIGYLRTLDIDLLISFILGVIVHLKNQGGIYISHLDIFIENYGNPYVINRKIWMPNFGQESRTPSFLTTKKGSRFDQLLSTTSTRVTWYQKWMDKCFFDYFPSLRTVAEISKDLYMTVLKTLTAQGILEQKSVKGDTTWGIRPEVLRVSTKVRQFRCITCGHHISVAAEESNYFENAPCQRFNCYGKYQPHDIGVDYYGKLYATGDVERIFAKEHTGLLKRDEREQLEIEFKSDIDSRKPWFPNLLSCTPTLEMGIDIGNLSSLILCSVPPAQANYLQRIGRTGRRDGNALNLTVANARPHDLFFFEEPEEMLSGHMDPPGIFLDASAVLERQFTAFCFDKWIVTETVASIPKRLGQVLNNLEPVNIKNFPHSFIYFIETNQVDLFDQFIILFKNNGTGLTKESESQLKVFVEGDRKWHGSLHYRIMNGLHDRKLERDSLKKKVQILNGKIRKKKTSPKDRNFDKDLRELTIEKSALQALVRNISDRDTFNFFTDEGLLPNYAFPEAGVMLNSLIHRKKEKVQEGKSAYETWTYDYERPAASAIQELAPANTFYAEGRKVKIDQVDMTVSEIETWRFCNNCSHKELAGQGEEKNICIKCGSPMWADSGQKRLMLKMRQVFASTSDRKSRINDDSDDREPVFYNKQMLVEFDKKHIVDAYKADADFPFGFEFLSKVDFCEINFGEKTEIGEKISIAGIEMPRQGFSVCRVCGKVQENNQEPSHAFICTAKNQESDKHLIDCLYLYRQFTSEAIRILLPVSIISESNRKLQSFIAAIQLGLKKKFKGKIDHLQTTVHEEPISDSTYKRKYLVLYDTIPGGTGYLKQLMRSEHQLMEVLYLACNVLKSCPCNQDENKDGCYRCLFAYRSSYNMPETSRDAAIELLADILTYRDRMVKAENISDISINTFIDSELEARFLGALKLYRSAALPLVIKNDLVNGKPGYFLKLGDRPYYIEPQVKLNKLNGVSIQSSVDFMIRPARLSDETKPIAVFLDGYTYHQSRIGQDMAQRMAIVQSGKYHIWSMTWHDVEHKFKSQGNYFEDYMDPSTLPSGGNLKTLLEGYGLGQFKKYIKYNSFDLLIHFLENPDEAKWNLFMLVVSMMHINPKQYIDKDSAKKWIQDIEHLFPEYIAEKIIETDCPNFTDSCLYASNSNNDDENQYLKQYVLVEKNALKPPANHLGVRVGCYFHDTEKYKVKAKFQSEWNGFLRLYNYYQFLPYSYFVTSEGNKAKAYDTLKVYEEALADVKIVEKELTEESWKELKELTEEYIHPLLDLLKKNDWPEPIAGYELESENGEIIACAELAWESIKIAFLTDEEREYQDTFLDKGWKTFMLSEVLADPDQYINI
ncbi:heavy metal transporter CzcA [Candidatus Magnetomorum sp. HK-1]|nr:heavy metal transporter CzcA [Candidatus Magnetomorum sp. HK-1]